MCIRDRLYTALTRKLRDQVLADVESKGMAKSQMSILDALLKLRPVSYTHLDVYKRQLQSLVGAAVLGEFSTFSMDSVTPLSAGALLYLVIFGAIIAYTCYFWLLLHTRTCLLYTSRCV